MSDDLLRSVFKNITPIEQTNELESVATPVIGDVPQQTSSGISGVPDSIEQSNGQDFFSQQAGGIIWQNQSPYVMNQGNFNLDGDVATVDIGGEAFTPVPSEFKPPEGEPLPGLDDPDPIGTIGEEVGGVAPEPLDWNDIISGRTTHVDTSDDEPDIYDGVGNWYEGAGISLAKGAGTTGVGIGWMFGKAVEYDPVIGALGWAGKGFSAFFNW